MFENHFPQWLISTPLDDRVLSQAGRTYQPTHTAEFTDGTQLLQVGNSLLDLKEMLYHIVKYGHDHHDALNRFEASTVLWLMVYKDLLHDNRFFPTQVRVDEFLDRRPYAPFDMFANTVKEMYPTKKPTTKITKVKPIVSQISNPDRITNQTLRKTYWQPIYDFYVNKCQGDINGTAIVPDNDAENWPLAYHPNINCYSLALQAWLNNNIPIAVAIVKSDSADVLDTAAIINTFTECETANPNTNGDMSLRVIKPKQLRRYQPLLGHRKSVEKIIKFLNI